MLRRDAGSSKRNLKMRSLYSILDTIVTAGTVNGWRIDAIAIGGLVWALTSGFTKVRLAIA